jgi:hypothetical protein
MSVHNFRRIKLFSGLMTSRGLQPRVRLSAVSGSKCYYGCMKDALHKYSGPWVCDATNERSASHRVPISINGTFPIPCHWKFQEMRALLTREWSNPTCRNLPWFLFTARVHTTKSTVKILAANTHCKYFLKRPQPICDAHLWMFGANLACSLMF